MKRSLDFSRKKLLFILSIILFLIVGTVLAIVIRIMSNSLLTQTASDRWSKEGDAAQVSCFFSVNAEVTPDSIENFRHNLDSALVEASIYSTSENENARLWADAYSATGKITVTRDDNSITSDAFGIGGDFFLFHPVSLLKGSYFSGNDLMQDYVVLDETAAWKLFGSNDIAGMNVDIGGVPHIVVGVVEAEEGRLVEAGGLSGGIVYVSYATLEKYGTNHGINHYEITMPNPVSSYAYTYVKDNIGVDEAEVEIIENSTRYDLLNRLKLIQSFGTRSMNGKAIIYPYWENVARGYEDIISTLTFMMLLMFSYPLITFIVLLVRWWRGRSWTMKSVFLMGKDKIERKIEKQRLKKKKEEPKYEELI